MAFRPALFCFLAICVAAPASAVTITLDGSWGSALAPQAGTSALEAETMLASRGLYGPALALEGPRTTASPDDARLAALIAAARAAAGDIDGAGAALALLSPGEAEPWQSIAAALIARSEGAFDAAAGHAAAAIAAAPGNAYARNVAGSIAAAQGDLAGALQAFSTAAELAPAGAVYFTNLGAVLAELGEPVAARRALEHAVALGARDCATWIGLGAVSEAEVRPDLAADNYDACLAVDPDNPYAAPQAVAARLAAGETRRARETALGHRAGLPDPELTFARIALHEGDPNAARRELAAAPPGGERDLLAAVAAAMAGDPVSGARRAAAVAEVSGAPVAALAHVGFAAAAGTTPDPELVDSLGDDPRAELLLALAAVGAGDATTASARFAAATDAIPGLGFAGLPESETAALRDAAGALALATTLDILGYRAGAADGYRAAVAAAPDAAIPNLLLGRAVIADDRPAGRAALAATLERAPRLEAAHRLLAEDLGRSGEVEAAVGHYEQALSVRDSAETRLIQGAMAESIGRTDTARVAYERAVVLAPDWFASLNQLAWFLVSQDAELDRAYELVQRADLARPGNASVLDTKGWIEYRRGEMEKALETLRRADAAAGGAQEDIALHLAEVEAALARN